MSGRLTGTLRLARAHLRSAWLRLLLWVALLAALVVATGASIASLYPTRTDRLSYARSAGVSPAVAAFNGRGYDLTELGAIVGYEVGFMALVGFPIVAIHLAIRFTRREEDAGRTELVTSRPVGRWAPLASACCVLSLVIAVFTVLTAIGLQLTADLPASGTWLYTPSLAAFMAAHAGVGLLAAEVSRESRTALALGLIFVLVTFLARAVIDGRGWDATWSGPSGWLAEVRPWGDVQWWPFAAYALFALAGLASALLLSTRRDLGDGMLSTRAGPAHAPARLGTEVGLAWRLVRGGWVGWLAGTLVWSIAFGALAGEMVDIVRANPGLMEALGLERPEQMVTSLALLLCALGGAAFGVQAIIRLASEESTGRLGLLLSGCRSRVRVWSWWTLLSALSAGIIVWLSAIALGLATAWSTGELENIGNAATSGLVLLTPVALIIAIAAALQAIAPRWAAGGWVLVAWVSVVGMLAEPLQLPDWARRLSPVYSAGQVGIDPADIPALLIMALATLILTAAGLTRFATRDLTAG